MKDEMKSRHTVSDYFDTAGVAEDQPIPQMGQADTSRTSTADNYLRAAASVEHSLPKKRHKTPNYSARRNI